MTSAAMTSDAVTSADRRPVWLLARHLMSTGFSIVAWFGATVLLAWGVLLAVFLTFTDIRTSVWEWVSITPPKWFLLVVGIVAAGVELPMYIAQGITRRHYALACLVCTGFVVGAFATVGLAWYGIDYLTLAATGHLSELTSPYPVRSIADGLAVLVGAVVVLLAWTCSGWLVGLGFYRFGALWGLPFLLLAALPLVAVEWAFEADQLGFALDVTVGIAAVAAGVAGIYFLIRDVPVRKISG